jgi:predicted alpha/beta hydrolase
MQNCKTNVILIAYRGFSDSDGDSKPTESNIIADSSTIFEYGITISKRDNLPLFAIGRSLGGAAAIGVYSQEKYRTNIKGLIL